MNKALSSLMEIDFLDSSEHARAAKRWQDLEQEIHNTHLTNSWVWIETWLKQFSDVPHQFAFGTWQGRTVGAALICQPWEKFKHAIPLRALYIGTCGEPAEESAYVECNRLLVAPEYLSTFSATLMENLQELPWSQMTLHGFVPEHAEALIAAGQDCGLPFLEYEKRACPTFQFSQVAEDLDLISGLKKNKKRTRKTIDKLKAQAPLSCEWAETKEQAHDILKELIKLHKQRWQDIGRDGDFATGRVIRYHEDLIEALFPQSLFLFRVKSGEQTLGCLMSFVEEKHILGYKSGFDISPEMKAFIPGMLTHVFCMEESRKRGYAEYDFLAGEAAYKSELSNAENQLVWATAHRGALIHTIDLLKKAKSIIQR